MNYVNILKSKKNNPHYLNRYIKFINSCMNQNLKQNVEIHHICPKSNDLFPELINEEWNLIKLSLRQHYIAHMLLWKAYGGKQTQAFKLMCNRYKSPNSRLYETVRNNHSNFMRENNPNSTGKYSKEYWKNVSDDRKIQQSKIAAKRNLEYWKIHKKPKQNIICSFCFSTFEVDYKERNRKFCSKSCSAKFFQTKK